MNAPRKHHYLPEFYLKRWTGDDGELTRFWRVREGKLDSRRVPPSRAAFVPDLYRMPGEHEDEIAAQLIEASFFRLVDNDAAVALEILEGNKPWSSWTDMTRSGWSRFVLSLLQRSPRHWNAVINELRRLDAETLHEFEGRYQELRSESDPETFEKWLSARDPHYLERKWRELAVENIDDPFRGNSLNNLRWFVVDLSRAQHRLLTSDNAVILVPIERPDGHIALPISPSKLFVATKQLPFFQKIEELARRSPGQIVKWVNRLSVERADEVVIATDESQKPFIEKHFGTNRLPTFGVAEDIAP